MSLGRAAQLAGLAYSEMVDELSRRGISVVRLPPGELDRELAAWAISVVVANAGPLIALGRVDRLVLLTAVFQQVQVLHAVLAGA